MWLTSKSPACERVARCSLMVPSKLMGNSKPAKDANFAPRSRCNGSRGDSFVVRLLEGSLISRPPASKLTPRAVVEPERLAAYSSFPLRWSRPKANSLSSVASSLRSGGLRVSRGGCSFGANQLNYLLTELSHWALAALRSLIVISSLGCDRLIHSRSIETIT